ncbi:MAG: TIR domain-containing protein [Cryobacterium sp.]|nr:TIR domain-containing protein [Cryobacterium sp.]
MAKSVFYSFHYDRDVHRVQLVRNINSIDGAPSLNGQEWESVRRQNQETVQKWIDSQMNYKKAVIVLIGQETSTRPWVLYEIQRAWSMKKPLLGVRIHGLASMSDGPDRLGGDPFAAANISNIPIFDPTVKSWDGTIDTKATYAALKTRLPNWAEMGRVKASW